MLSFDKYEPTAIERTATLLTGNIINALNAASVAKLSSQMINYTDASGNRQRAVMLYDDCELEEVLDKVKGLSTIQEAITYFERVHDAIEMNENLLFRISILFVQIQMGTQLLNSI